MNRFLYALANPATLIDPTGHMAEISTSSGGYVLPIVTQTDDGTNCSRRCIDAGMGPQPAPVPNQVAPLDETIGFMGYAPWELDADPTLSELTSAASIMCNGSKHARGGSDQGSCAFLDDLKAWKDQNKELYCSIHRAICDAHERGLLHNILGGLGMVPVIGVLFDGADALLYLGEGDYLGATIAIGFAIPGIGDAARAGSYAADGVGAGLKMVDNLPAPGTFCSFTPETTVVTPDGHVPIGELRVGDEVLARDEETGQTSVREVVAVLVHADEVTGSVVIDGEVIETTPEHPFFSLDRGFVPASELRVGELVATASGPPGTVQSVSWTGGPAVMWNLTVAVDHTFFVGEGGWWVHNFCGDLPAIATNAGLPRDALGRFTSGAGGASAATATGTRAHVNYANALGGGDYVFNRALQGSRLRPDAVSYSQNIVRELKPSTPGAISHGWRQVNAYKAYLEGLTGQRWTAFVDVYNP